MNIYLDNCCFNRPFDDQSQLRIRLEAEAKLTIQEDIRAGSHTLIWSYILDYENHRNPFRERREQIALWRSYALTDIQENEEVIRIATGVHAQGIKKLDALHIACAITAKANFFLTTDDGVLLKALLVRELKIRDPIGFIKEISS